jgi:methionine biosynthesis protein metW
MNNSEWNPIAEKWNLSTQDGNWFHKYIIYPTVLDLLGNPHEKKILDVGCGNGHLAHMLQAKGAIATGIDKSEEMIRICRQRYPEVNFVNMDVTESVDLSEKFDCAIFNNSLQDMECYQKGLYNTRRLLIQHGTLIIIVKHPCFHPRLSENGWRLQFKDTGNFRVTGHGLTALLDEKDKYSGIYFSMDNYYSDNQHNRTWFGNSTISFARTLEEYFNTLISANFTIKKILEPKPRPEGQSDQECLYNLLMRIPNFLVIHATKGD